MLAPLSPFRYTPTLALLLVYYEPYTQHHCSCSIHGDGLPSQAFEAKVGSPRAKQQTYEFAPDIENNPAHAGLGVDALDQDISVDVVNNSSEELEEFVADSEDVHVPWMIVSMVILFQRKLWRMSF